MIASNSLSTSEREKVVEGAAEVTVAGIEAAFPLALREGVMIEEEERDPEL